MISIPCKKKTYSNTISCASMRYVLSSSDLNMTKKIMLSSKQLDNNTLFFRITYVFTYLYISNIFIIKACPYFLRLSGPMFKHPLPRPPRRLHNHSPPPDLSEELPGLHQRRRRWWQLPPPPRRDGGTPPTPTPTTTTAATGWRWRELLRWTGSLYPGKGEAGRTQWRGNKKSLNKTPFINVVFFPSWTMTPAWTWQMFWRRWPWGKRRRRGDSRRPIILQTTHLRPTIWAATGRRRENSLTSRSRSNRTDIWGWA